MSTTVESVLADALRLDAAGRAEIATELLASLDAPVDPAAEAAWAAEIQRRVAELDAGAAKLESWDDVRRRIEATILKK
jgi:putative addiction module component (TIGR02574 family)